MLKMSIRKLRINNSNNTNQHLIAFKFEDNVKTEFQEAKTLTFNKSSEKKKTINHRFTEAKNFLALWWIESLKNIKGQAEKNYRSKRN